MYDIYTIIPIVVVLAALYFTYRWRTRISIADIRGPKSQSFLLGHFAELTIPPCGVTEAKWQEEFGNAFRIKGSFGEDQLFITDPKALQHMFQTSGYNYRKLPAQRVLTALLLDRGLVWAESTVHKRHRKVMLPAFGTPETRAFLPIFNDVIAKVAAKWFETAALDPVGNSAVVDVHFWMSKATLDAIGFAAFDYDFGSIEDTGNPLTKSYDNIFFAGFGTPSFARMLFESASDNIPYPILSALFEYAPGEGLQKLRENRAEVHKVSKKLLEDKQETLLRGRGKRDLMSLLVKSNASENEKSKLRDDELIPQMRSILLAGHETTANTVSWTLYELAKNPHMQTRMRTEIREAKAKISARGDIEFSAADYENMPYTVAVMKETLRLYPIAFKLFRKAYKDDVLPLYKPIVTKSGQVMNEIPIAKGTNIVVSIDGANTNKDVWGEDALIFNPERWFGRKKVGPSLGVYGNMMSFSAGTRSCIGWRFAILEMQSFLVCLLQNFEFSIPERSKPIRKDRSGVMVPMVEGERDKGAKLPLKISLVSD